MQRRTVLGLIAVIVSAACAHAAPRRFDPGEFALSNRDVAAGTSMEVWLERTIATTATVPGERLTARVLAPVRAVGGNVVIPVGAVVRGRVAAMETGPRPAIALTFDSVDTYWTTVLGAASVGRQLRGLTPEMESALKDRLRARLAVDAQGRVQCQGRANAVRGSVAR